MRRLIAPVLLGLIAVGPAMGQRAPQASVSELTRLQAEYRDEGARARRLRADAAEAASEIAELDRRLSRLTVEVQTDDVQIEAQRARLHELGEREATLVTALSRERGRQGRLLSALQMMSRRPPPPLLISADKATDTVRAAILLKAVAPDLQSRAATLAGRQAEIGRVRRLAALSSERLFTTESAQGDRRAEMEGLRTRKRELSAVLRAEAAAAEKAAAVLEARIRELGGAVPAEEAAIAAPAARLPAGRNRLTPPIDAAPSTRFADGAPGWRWRADAETARAPAAGTVAYAGPLSGWGDVVILDLGPGWRAVVAGLDSLSVEAGDRVADGQALGRTAADGEVYFELRRDERPIDPAPWLP